MTDDHQPTLGKYYNFPQKVHALLNYAHRNDLESVACWNADGKGFYVVSPSGFMKEIAPHFFPNHTAYRSFERMLNIWGFERRRSASSVHSFWSNPHFRRDRPDLCKNMVRIENKGTKQRVSVSGMQRCIQVKNNIPNWAKEHQQAALMHFYSQNSQHARNNNNKRMERTEGLEIGEQVGDEEGKQEWLQSQLDKANKAFGPSEEDAERDRNTVAHPPCVTHQLDNEELGRPAASLRLKQPPGEARTYHSHNENKLAIASPSRGLLSPSVNTHCTSRDWRIEVESGLFPKPKKRPAKESASKQNFSFLDENDSLGTLVQSNSSGCRVQGFPEGQFDDAPESLLVLADVAVSSSNQNAPPK